MNNKTVKKKYITLFFVFLAFVFLQFFVNHHGIVNYFLNHDTFADKKDMVSAHWQGVPRAQAQGQTTSKHPLIDGKELESKQCGYCHFQIYNQWKGTHHAKSTLNVGEIPKFGFCFQCHAPLYEQRKQIMMNVTNESYNPKLHNTGVNCAACHVRKGELKGYLRSPGRFQDPQFCKSCHQMDSHMISGKIAVNIYNEWEASPAAKKNITCQKCHMPDGDHQLRGITHESWVSEFVSAELKQASPQLYEYVFTNKSVGHKFPARVGAKVTLFIQGFDEKQKLVQQNSYVIQWKINADFTQEVSDTRLDPQQFAKVELKTNPEIKSIKAFTEVDTDYFYNKINEYKQKTVNPSMWTPKDRPYKKPVKIFLRQRDLQTND